MRVALCRPIREYLDPGHQRCCDLLGQALQKRGHQLFDCSVLGCANVDRGRAISAAQALGLNAESMIWADSDMVFDAEEAVRMHDLALERRAVIGALYSTKQRRGKIVGCNLPGRFVAYDGGEVVPVRAVGFGLVAFSASVYLRICDFNKLPHLKIDGLVVRPAWMPYAIGDEYPTDDTCFCERATAAGVAVLADTRVRARHAGRYEYRLEDTVDVPQDVGSLKLQIGNHPAGPTGSRPPDRSRA